MPIKTCQPKYLSMPMPALVNPKTIIPAITTPTAIKGKAFKKGMLNKKAIKTPVHAPVIGNGIATKAIKASAPYFSILFLCSFLILLKNQEKKF